MIADGLVDPSQAGVSREEQRRRILFALEAPLPVAPAPQRGPVGPKRDTKTARIESLRRRLWVEKDPQRRMDISETIRELTRVAPVGEPS